MDFFSRANLFAQAAADLTEVTEIAANPAPTKINASDVPRKFSLLSSSEFALSMIVLVFGAYVIFIQYKLFRSAKIPFSSGDVMRAFGVTIILIGACLTMTAGYRSEQVAPVLGVFGTIAGYLLGRLDRSPPEGSTAGEHAPPEVAPPQNGPTHKHSRRSSAEVVGPSDKA